MEVIIKLIKARAFSLIIIISLANHSGDKFSSWLNYLVHAIPAFIFLSAYMGFVIILIEQYYRKTTYQNHLVKPTLLIITKGSYILLGFLAFLTLGINIY